ncbi:unnamed protein product [Closterium sp. Naga37s-1]|nr:unnamed protein product [Closterium sp. Naga37s-1]
MALSRYLLRLVVFSVALAAHHAISATALRHDDVREPTSLRALEDSVKVKRPLPTKPPQTLLELTSSPSMLPARALPRRALKHGATTTPGLNSPLQAAETDSESDSIEDSGLEDVALDGGAAETGGDARRGLLSRPQISSNDARKRGEALAKKAAKKAGEKAAKKALEYAAKKTLTSAGGSAVSGIASMVGVGDGPTMLSKVGSDIERTGKVGRVIGKVMQNKVVNAMVNTVAPKPLMTGLNLAAEHYDDIKREGEKAGKAVGKEVSKAGKAVGKEVNKAGKAVGKEVNKAGKAVGKEVNKAGKAVGNEVNKAGKAVGKVGKAVGNAVGGAAKNTVNDMKKAGQAVGNAAKKALSGFSGLFGRK